MIGKRTGGPERIEDARLSLYTTEPLGLSIDVHQLGYGPGHIGRLKVNFYWRGGRYLTADPDALAALVARLANVWSARNAWVDMVHVRQKWNRWEDHRPVYGWATWLRDDFATVDPTGLDVRVEAGDGGVLLVLPVDAAAMADSDRDVGRATIEALAARTVLTG
jgi:hypothetical protein